MTQRLASFGTITCHAWDQRRQVFVVEVSRAEWRVGDDLVGFMVDRFTGATRAGVPPYRVARTGQRFHSLDDAARALRGGPG